MAKFNLMEVRERLKSLIPEQAQAGGDTVHIEEDEKEWMASIGSKLVQLFLALTAGEIKDVPQPLVLQDTGQHLSILFQHSRTSLLLVYDRKSHRLLIMTPSRTVQGVFVGDVKRDGIEFIGFKATPTEFSETALLKLAKALDSAV